MEKLLFFAFILSPGLLFAFLRVPEPPTLTPTLAATLTLEARTPCQVATAHPSAYEAGLNVASSQVERLAELAR